MSEPAAKSKSSRKSAAKPSTAPVRLGRSPLTGYYVFAPYPKKGGTDPAVIREVVRAVVAGRKA